MSPFIRALVVLSVLVPPPLRAEAPDAPLRVALLVDTSEGVGTAVTQIRAAVIAFADALPPEHEIALVTTGRRPHVRVPPTVDRRKVKDSAGGITSDGGPTPLMDALVEVDERYLQRADDRFPVFVILTGDGSENSSRTDGQTFNRWLAGLSKRPLSAHAILLRYRGDGGLPDVIVTAMTRATGGRLDVTTVAGSLPDRMKAMAAHILADRHVLGPAAR